MLDINRYRNASASQRITELHSDHDAVLRVGGSTTRRVETQMDAMRRTEPDHYGHR